MSDLMECFQDADSDFLPNLSGDLKQSQDIVFKMVRDVELLELEPNVFIKKCVMKRLRENVKNLNFKIQPYQISGRVISYIGKSTRKDWVDKSDTDNT